MTQETLDKAKKLEQDIRAIGRILEERAKHNWIQVIAPRVNNTQTSRFQDELAEWLKEKKIQYERELEELQRRCNMNDLISKRALLNNLNNWALAEAPNERMDEVEKAHQNIAYEIILGCMETVEKQPTVKAVSVVHGKWLHNGFDNEWECSHCHSQIALSDDRNAHPNFCPNCGADMWKKVQHV